MNDQETTLTTSDADCIERSRSGDVGAFAELWHRHHRAALRAAAAFTTIDADDLVAEAYTRIYQRIRDGGGPVGAFRPYLYTTIRNLARSWGSARREVNLEHAEHLEDFRHRSDPAVDALDRSLTATAFRSLPERWQSVLWYSEIEGMDPHEIAPLLGLTPNGVAALSYRAREGLRRAWLQAHVRDEGTADDCRWARSRLGDHSRGALGERAQSRMIEHLAGCAGCAIVSDEVDAVGSQLALVLVPIALGAVAGGTLIAALAEAGSPAAAAVPPLPDAVLALSAPPAEVVAALVAPAAGGAFAGSAAASGAAAGGAAAGGVGGVLSGAGALAGSAALVAVLGGGMLRGGGLPPDAGAESTVVASSSSTTQAPDPDPTPDTDPGSGASSGGRDTAGEPATPVPSTDRSPSPEAAPADTGGLPHPDRGVGGLVGDLVEDLSGDEPPAGHTAPGGVLGADIRLDLAGTATPGAHLSLQAAGQVYATTTVAADGTFVLTVTALPEGITGLALVQTIDEGYLEGRLGDRGLLGRLLGTLESLVQELVRPLSLSTPTGGVAITLLTR